MPAIRAAILSDIHGNAPALEVVLADAGRPGVTRFYNLGDTVGEATFPNETVELLIRYGVVSILGNFDRSVTDCEGRIARMEQRKHPARDAAIRFTQATISLHNLRHLSELPRRGMVETEGNRFLLVHGSPRRDSEFIRA
jgi:predicted phosphodiesterase